MCKKEKLSIKCTIFIILSFHLLSCSLILPNEKELLDAVKRNYGYTDAEYAFKTKIIKVEENDIKNILYSHIAWVEVTHIKTGNSWKTQFGLKKDGHKWDPTISQLEEEIANLKKLQKQLNR